MAREKAKSPTDLSVEEKLKNLYSFSNEMKGDLLFRVANYNNSTNYHNNHYYNNRTHYIHNS